MSVLSPCFLISVCVVVVVCRASAGAQVDVILRQLREACAAKLGSAVLEKKNGEWQVASLDLGGAELTDNDLFRIAQMKALENVSLEGQMQATKQGWRSLRVLQDLDQLSLPHALTPGELTGGWTDPAFLPSFQKLKLPFSCSVVALKALAESVRLESLEYYENIEGNKLDKVFIDSSMREIGSAGGLRSLTLPVQGIGEASLEYILRLKKLETLSVLGSSLGDSGVPKLAALANLRSLRLNSISQQGVNALSNLPRLESLVIGGGAGEALDMSGLSRITYLALAAEPCAPPWGNSIRWPPNLQSLAMPSWRKGDAIRGERILQPPIPESLDSLRLRLWDASPFVCVTPKELADRQPADLKWLERLPNLKGLELENPTVKDFEAVLALAGLRRLAVIGDRGILSAEAVGKVKQLQQLQFLRIAVECPMTDATIEAISELKGLQHLEAGDTRKITAVGLSCLWKLSRLEVLILWMPSMTADGSVERAFGGIGSLGELNELSLKGALTDQQLKDLATLKKLRRIDLSRSQGFTDEGLAELVKALPELAEVSLSNMPPAAPKNQDKGAGGGQERKD